MFHTSRYLVVGGWGGGGGLPWPGQVGGGGWGVGVLAGAVFLE